MMSPGRKVRSRMGFNTGPENGATCPRAACSRSGAAARVPPMSARPPAREARPPRALLGLPLFQRLALEAFDLRLEQAVEIELRLEMQEHRAEPDGGAVHQHELARDGDRALRLQPLLHLPHLAPAVGVRRDAVGDGAHAVVEKRRVDEARPKAQRVDQLVVRSRKPQIAIGLGDSRRGRRSGSRDRAR